MPTPKIDQKIIMAQLSFLKNTDWWQELTRKLDINSTAFYTEQLVSSAPGLGYCMDERPIKESDPAKNLQPKPAFVGGAAGWTVMFMLSGKNLPEAITLTVKLYQQKNWRKMEIHTDDHGKLGCGFLNVLPKVIEILQELQIPGLSAILPEFNGNKIYSGLQQAGATEIILTKAHKTEQAKVVINQRLNTTLNRQALYKNNPAFLWDTWATTDQDTLQAYNGLAETNLKENDFLRLQAALHLATGLCLNAVRLEGPNKNLVILQ